MECFLKDREKTSTYWEIQIIKSQLYIYLFVRKTDILILIHEVVFVFVISKFGALVNCPVKQANEDKMFSEEHLFIIFVIFITFYCVIKE